ncbi:MAG: hypothetical protein QG635_1484, partial [Bacteroidota bacterium]|nr:hypothetical protein [Bacteroidota bacterium]
MIFLQKFIQYKILYMDKIDIYQKIQPFIDEEFSEYPAAVRKMINYFMKFLLKINRINQFINIHNDKTGLEFIDEIFDYLDFSYNISDKDRRRIPSEGKLLIASNHPLGALDGLALLKSITEIRKDVKILANDVILNIEQISEFMIPVNIFKSNKKRDSLLHIEKAMTEEQALIIFPAGEVSRLGINGIKDGRWQKSIVKLSVKYNAPILPVYINARNSYLFYLVSMLIKKYSFLLLPREMFKKSGVSIKIKIGDMIPASAFAKNTLDLSQSAKILRKHIYSLRNGKHGYFSTEKTVIHPVDSRLIKKELISNESLGQTSNGKHIFMCDYDSS